MSSYEKKGMENNVPPWLVSPSVEVKFSHVPGLYLRKYGMYVSLDKFKGLCTYYVVVCIIFYIVFEDSVT